MSLAIVYYCPSAGGNHLKNIINLAPEMRDHKTLDLGIYDGPNQGTVHSRAGRNVQVTELQAIIREPDHRWCICGHFGELAPKRDLLLQIPDRRIIIIGIDSTVDRWLLEQRQDRLGQNCHPYWLNEEQPYLYERAMCKEYWRTPTCMTVALEHFWNPDLSLHQITQLINQFLNISIPESLARAVHYRWWKSNFHEPEVQAFYSKHLTPDLAAL